ncbi:MAG: hypothetical protein AAGA65_10405 [Actinomycetota bacterium]
MILSNVDIREAVDSGEIIVDPFDPDLIKRNSYLLRLGESFRRISGSSVFDTADAEHYELFGGQAWEDRSVEVNPDSLVLATSLQKVAVGPGIVGVLSGISNVARLGVLVHATSAFVNAGFGMPDQPASVVFELATIGGRRVRLYSGTPVCHLAFLRTQTASDFPMPSRRTGQVGPDPTELLAQFGRYFLRH